MDQLLLLHTIHTKAKLHSSRINLHPYLTDHQGARSIKNGKKVGAFFFFVFCIALLTPFSAFPLFFCSWMNAAGSLLLWLYDDELTIPGGYSPGDTWIHHRHHNRSKKAANSRNKSKRGREERSILNKVSLGLADTSVKWHHVKYSPHNLYPKIPWVNGHPTRPPSSKELQYAMEVVSSYHFLSSGLNVVRDPLDKKSIIAIIEFTPFDQLTPSEKDDLHFVSTFLHQTKPFISPVRSSSRVWGGLMWALGWRKSYD